MSEGAIVFAIWGSVLIIALAIGGIWLVIYLDRGDRGRE